MYQLRINFTFTITTSQHLTRLVWQVNHNTTKPSCQFDPPITFIPLGGSHEVKRYDWSEVFIPKGQFPVLAASGIPLRIGCHVNTVDSTLS